MNNQAIKELRSAKPLDRIPVADKPLLQGGEVYYLSHREFEEKFKCKLTEGIYGNEDLAQKQKKEWDAWYEAELAKISEEKRRIHSLCLANHRMAIQQRLQNPLKGLVICFIHPAVGYGLFTSEFIPENTVVGIYAGCLISSLTTSTDTRYVLGAGAGNQIATDAEDYGGMLRFMQHLPTIEDLDALPAVRNNSNVLQKIATANISLTDFSYGEIIVTMAYTNCDVPAGSILGFPYRGNYWQKENPYLFTKKSELLPLSIYDDKPIITNDLEQSIGRFKELAPPSFALHTKRFFPTVPIQVFFQNPNKSPYESDGYNVDAICRTHSTSQYIKQQIFFSQITDKLKFFPESNTIVVKDINSDDLKAFRESCQVLHKQRSII